MKPPLLDVNIKTWINVEFAGQAKSVSSTNETGPFDILPNHANFITRIKNDCRIVSDTGEKKVVPISGPALLRVYKNKVSVYLGLGTAEGF